MKTLKVFLSINLLIAFLVLVGCSQEGSSPVEVIKNSISENSLLEKTYNLPAVTLAELQQAKIATAKYNNIANAIADGYADIDVIVPHMGYHFMKASYVDGNFEIDKPEILVYSPNSASGRLQLVAIEYAIPNTEPQPEGFTGSYDVWDNNSTFGLWLLHAWVWEYNPDGVFAPMNPDVQ